MEQEAYGCTEVCSSGTKGNHQCTLYLYNWLACFRRLVSKTKRVSEQHYNSGGVDPLAFSLHSSAIIAPFVFRSVVVTEHLQQASNRWTLRKHLCIMMRCWRSIVIEPFGIPLKPCIFSGLFPAVTLSEVSLGKSFLRLEVALNYVKWCDLQSVFSSLYLWCNQVNVFPEMQCAVMIIFLFLLPYVARDLS